MKRIKLCSLFVILSLTAMAQEKKSFTLDDLLPGGKTYQQLQTQNMYVTWWGNQCIELENDRCNTVDAKSGAKKELFSLSQLDDWLGGTEQNPVIKSCRGASFPDAAQPLVAVRIIAQKDADSKQQRYAVIDFQKGEIAWTQDFPLQAKAIDRSPATRNAAYIFDHNLFITDAQNKTVQVSKDGSNDLVYGDVVHRNEFGIQKGTFWSPDGKQLAFYRMDQSMVPDYPQVDISPRIAQTFSCKYPMAGEAIHQVTVGVFNPETQQTVWLQSKDPKDRYFTNITWSPDSRKIYIIELNRDQNHAQLVRYDAATGKREGVFYEERHNKYVEPQHGLTFLPWDSSKCIYQSQRDGYNHLYLFDLNSSLYGDWSGQKGDAYWREPLKVTQLTSGKWVVNEILGFNEKEKSVLISSNEIHPLQSNIYKVKISNGKRTLLDDGTGVHWGLASADGTYIADKYSSPEVHRSLNLLDVVRKKSVNLLTADNPWKEYNVPEITSGSIKAADGATDLYYRMVKPVNFDPQKKYPTIVYVYGGPHAHNVEYSWNYLARGWEIYMAQKGYLMFILDNRGSENRGLEFENVTYRQLGTEEMKDQMEGVKFLSSLPYVDTQRIGVHGWSFGGFMATNLMLTYPETFKVGVAGGPVIDWKYYEAMYGERYMDTPQDNPEGYDRNNLCKKAGNLKGKLQIIIGYNDPVCVPQHSLAFIRACINAGTQPDFFTYPGGEHNMFGADRIHLHERITQYFEDYLK